MASVTLSALRNYVHSTEVLTRTADRLCENFASSAASMNEGGKYCLPTTTPDKAGQAEWKSKLSAITEQAQKLMQRVRDFQATFESIKKSRATDPAITGRVSHGLVAAIQIVHPSLATEIDKADTAAATLLETANANLLDVQTTATKVAEQETIFCTAFDKTEYGITRNSATKSSDAYWNTTFYLPRALGAHPLASSSLEAKLAEPRVYSYTASVEAPLPARDEHIPIESHSLFATEITKMHPAKEALFVTAWGLCKIHRLECDYATINQEILTITERLKEDLSQEELKALQDQVRELTKNISPTGNLMTRLNSVKPPLETLRTAHLLLNQHYVISEEDKARLNFLDGELLVRVQASFDQAQQRLAPFTAYLNKYPELNLSKYTELNARVAEISAMITKKSA